jgi:hypothetical protein
MPARKRARKPTEQYRGYPHNVMRHLEAAVQSA